MARSLATVAFAAVPAAALAQQISPPDHVVVVIEENHSYNEILGNTEAPYINSLASSGALFTNSNGVEHPSQPNYLDLFSGANQGVAGDVTSPLAPFTTPNLGAGLFAVGRTFADYSQGLPSVGFLGDSATDNPALNEYMRKHNPAANWQNDVNRSANQLPSSVNQPFTAFPPVDFSSLPTVSFVIPNEQNDMHDGTISQADSWLNGNLSSYAQWAKTHNSLLIVTFDENDDTAIPAVGDTNPNHIVTIFSGQNVIAGQYSETISHLNVLSTIENMYGVTPVGASALAAPITDAFVVPEPGTTAFLALGGAALAAAALRPRARAASMVLAVGLLGGGFTGAQADTVVAPNALATTTGDTPSLFPFFPGTGTALRYQQVYGASQFAAYSPGGEQITQLAFRVDPDTGFALASAALPSVQIDLSTTGAAPDGLSPIFANNTGADAVTVYDAALTFTRVPTLNDAPTSFDLVVTLSTPFLYDPSKGNLLLDVRNFDGGDTAPTQSELDGTMSSSDALSSAYNFGDANALSVSQSGGQNDFSTEGVVTQFVASPVPEPAPAVLTTLAGSVLLAGFLRRSRAVSLP